MLCVWVHGCDSGRVSDISRLALYQTLSIEYPSSVFFWHVLCVIVPFFLSFFFMLSLILCRCSSYIFLSSRLRTGLAADVLSADRRFSEPSSE